MVRSVDFDVNRSIWTSDKPEDSPCPPLRGPIRADVAVIGGGFTGVSTAWNLARRFPFRRVVLLEARALAHGASGRNGGMMLNWVNGVEHHDPVLARRIYGVTRDAIDEIVERITAHGLPVGYRRDGCLEVFTSPARADAAAREAERLQAAGLPIRWLDRAALRDKVALDGVEGALLDPTAGMLDGVDLLRAMRPLLLEAGVGVYEGTPVTRITEGSVCALETPDGEVRADAIVLATNAWTPSLGYFRHQVFPLLGHVVATDPLDEAARSRLGWGGVAAFSDDSDRVAYSCMDPRGRVVFGGGSNASYAYRYGGSTTWSGDASARSARVEARLRQYLPGLEGVPVAARWTGPMAITLTRVCAMGVRGQHRNVYYALGYSGHGVTLANLAGRVLTDLYAGEPDAWLDLPFLVDRPRFIPPEPLRWLGYQAFTRATGRSPRRRR